MYTPNETSSENLQLLQGLVGNMQDSRGGPSELTRGLFYSKGWPIQKIS